MAKKIREKKKLVIVESRLKNKPGRVSENMISVKKVKLSKKRSSDKMDTGSDQEEKKVMATLMARQKDRSSQGLKDETTKLKVEKLKKYSQKRPNLLAKAGEADRRTFASKPKFLFSGKRKAGTHNRR
jgi:hypothetical protein